MSESRPRRSTGVDDAIRRLIDIGRSVGEWATNSQGAARAPRGPRSVGTEDWVEFLRLASVPQGVPRASFIPPDYNFVHARWKSETGSLDPERAVLVYETMSYADDPVQLHLSTMKSSKFRHAWASFDAVPLDLTVNGKIVEGHYHPEGTVLDNRTLEPPTDVKGPSSGQGLHAVTMFAEPWRIGLRAFSTAGVGRDELVRIAESLSWSTQELE